MEEKELVQLQNKSQSVTNILNEDFDFKWDWIDYTLEKWETKHYPKYLSDHCAFHMARKYALDNKKNFEKEAWIIVDKALWKETIEYNKLTISQAKELCKERKISLETVDWWTKNKAQLIQDLKISH